MSDQPVHIAAPAKLNFYLHITGKRDDGYHLLDSLCVFTDITDTITISAADKFTLSIDGPFAPFIKDEPVNDNLVTRAAYSVAKELGRETNIAITLEKNIPPGAGLGGGSSDAAATIKALLQFWNTELDDTVLYTLLEKLGSDVPACYTAQPVIMGGVGEVLPPAPALPADMQLVVIYPQTPSSTIAAYRNFAGAFTPAAKPDNIDTHDALIAFLSEQKNDLYTPALQNVPVIEEVLTALNDQDGILLARMSGSGSACFGIYENGADVDRAVREISRLNPTWWVRRAGLWSPH